MQKGALQLCNIFQDNNFAWELLNAQIDIEMSTVASGETIAFLLQLYMRGVQKMNSLGDPRESYFKNKVTSLMTKQTVIKSLKQNPMKKKARHDQAPSKQVKTKQDPKSKQMTSIKRKQIKPQVNQLQLQQKRRQLQMRMAYVAEQHGPQNLKKIIAQQDNRQQNISSKINKIINSHQERLNERIKARKLKTATFRSRSEINMQDNHFVQFGQYEKQELKMEKMSFEPFQKLLLHKYNKKQQQKEKIKQQLRKAMGKRYSSLSLERNLQSPQKKARKYTHDQINPKKSFS